MSDLYYLGLDLGSAWSKAVAVDAEGTPRARALVRTGLRFEEAAEALLRSVLRELGGAPARVAYTVATGCGRRNVPFGEGRRTEISCLARGVFHHCQREVDVVDVGAQDTAIIHVREGGAVAHFFMNRPCASGTGTFVEELARRLDLPLADLQRYAASASEEATLASSCTVYSAAEVVRRLRAGESPENLCRAIFTAVVDRIVEMGPLGPTVVLSGGVAEAFPVLAELLGARTGAAVDIPPHAQHLAALGAALLARSESVRAP